MQTVISLKNSLLGSRAAAQEGVDYRTIGDAHRDAKRWPEAAAAYRRHLETHPGDAAIWIQAGNCCKEAGNLAQSLTAYRRAEQLEPNNFEVHLQLGHLLKIVGNLSAALAAYERAAVLAPQHGEVKHEIREVANRMRLSDQRLGVALLYGSLDELLAGLRQLPSDEDPFISYFNAIGGYRIDQAT